MIVTATGAYQAGIAGDGKAGRLVRIPLIGMGDLHSAQADGGQQSDLFVAQARPTASSLPLRSAFAARSRVGEDLDAAVGRDQADGADRIECTPPDVGAAVPEFG